VIIIIYKLRKELVAFGCEIPANFMKNKTKKEY
jgi:hypothetical protein